MGKKRKNRFKKKLKSEALYKTKIIDSVRLLIKSLKNIDDLSSTIFQDENLKQSFRKINEVVSEGISKMLILIETLSKEAKWDRLNVSFFGETNAGKSTIIEALIEGNGESIGEGYKDFTKTVRTISYKGINLMDMPGIEGKEYKVINNISKAVNASHVVFYVIGTKKEPEEQTMTKIKNFLKGNAKVFSIINVRDKPTAYKYKKELKDKNTIIIEERVKSKFKDVLGANYIDNIVVNGHLALLKGQKIKDTRFENDKIRALEIFGSQNEFVNFSNIQEVYCVIDELSKSIQDEIIISNTYKFLRNILEMISKIQSEKSNFDDFIHEVTHLSNRYLEDVYYIISKYKNLLAIELDVHINRMKADLKKMFSDAIDNGYSEARIKSEFEQVRNNQSQKLNEKIKDLLSSMKEEIEVKIQEFKNRMSLQMNFLKFKGEFNFETIFKSLEIGVGYILGQIIDVGLSIWGVIVAFAINPILGIVAGVIALSKKIWDWFFADPDKRKREAKNKAFEKIDSMITSIDEKIKKDLKKELDKLNTYVEEPVEQMRKSMKELKDINCFIDGKMHQVKKTYTDLTILLMQEFLGQNVFFSYLDLELSEAVIIGCKMNQEEKLRLSKLLRINHIYLYLSLEQWLEAVGTSIAGNVFIAKGEFNYRAVNYMILHDNLISYNKILKEENV